MPEFMARYPGWNRRVLNRAAALVTPSAYLEQAIRPYGYHASIIPNIIQTERYPFRHRAKLAPRILWMRAFHPIYNPQMAIHAFAQVCKAFPEAELVMGGEENGLGAECRELARTLGIANQVRFPGFLDMESKLREGARADIHLHTNRIDNMPVSVVEFAALGLPIVATEIGGIPYLLRHEETGLLVPNESADAAAEAMVRLLRDPELAGRLSANGRSLAEKSAWESVRPQWVELIDEVAAACPNTAALAARSAG
jgi:glycosyltransferase involved in cell wall biosynthesis